MAQPTKSEGSAAGYLSQVLGGSKPASPELVQQWGRALRLDAEDAAVLRFLASLTYIPAEWQAEFVEFFNRDRTARGLPAVEVETPAGGRTRERQAHRKSRAK